MIDLGLLMINDETSLVESRNKILDLAGDLRFDSIYSTRLAAVASELIRSMLETGKPSSIKIGLGLKNNAFGLTLQFRAEKIKSEIDSKVLEEMFDNIVVSKTEDKLECIDVFKMLPNEKFDLNEEFIAREKELIGRMTRDELYKQLQNSYIDLTASTAQLIQTEKLGSLGTMTAGVAHELNNPMMGILNYIQYCMKKTDKSDKRYLVLQDAERETLRCITIVENLLTFSRMEKEGEEGFRQADCAEIMQRVILLLSYRYQKEGVNITTNYTKNTPHIFVKTNNIQQVFLNFINNSLDSMEESKKKNINIDIQPAGEYVQIAITDTGCGIPKGLVKKIYEPFYTTKPPGKGTGLGLSICQSIIADHKGSITCESKLGQGTKFIISLPVTLAKQGM